MIFHPIGLNAEPQVRDFLSAKEVSLLENLKWKGFSAVYNNVAVGILLYHMQDNYIILDRILVKPGYRRNGIGKELLGMLCKYAKTTKKRLLFSFDATGNKDVFYRFIASTHDFVIDRQEGFEAYLTAQDVLDIGQKNIIKADNAEFFFEQKNHVKEEFIAHLAKSYEQIAWELKHCSQSYRKDLSCCILENGVVQAVTLVKQREKELELKLIYGRYGKGKQTAEALFGSFKCMDEKKALPIKITTANEAEIKILNYICPGYEITKRFYVAYYIGS